MASLSPLWVKITDFGVSKRWAGTVLDTQCGTPLYQAPEVTGFLPEYLKTGRPIHTWSVDIWSLGAVMHEVLTSEIPFLEVYTQYDDSIYGSIQPSINGALLSNYCAGRSLFPTGPLTKHSASADAVDFVKSLMIADPNRRTPAATALQSAWLSQIATLRAAELAFPGPPQSELTELPVRETKVPGRTSSPNSTPSDTIIPRVTDPRYISPAQRGSAYPHHPLSTIVRKPVFRATDPANLHRPSPSQSEVLPNQISNPPMDYVNFNRNHSLKSVTKAPPAPSQPREIDSGVLADPINDGEKYRPEIPKNPQGLSRKLSRGSGSARKLPGHYRPQLIEASSSARSATPDCIFIL